MAFTVYSLQFRALRWLELEIVLGVVVGDVLNHLVDTLSLIAHVRHFAVLDVCSNEVAENTTEILVTRVGEERTGVGEHTHETTQQSKQ